MIRRPPRSTQSRSSAASDVYKRQLVTHSKLPAGDKRLELLDNVLVETAPTHRRQRKISPLPLRPHGRTLGPPVTPNSVQLNETLKDLTRPPSWNVSGSSHNLSQYSMPFWPRRPLEKACFTVRISVTVSASSTISLGAPRPVIMTDSCSGLPRRSLITASTSMKE